MSLQGKAFWTRRQALYLLSGALGSVALHSCAQSTQTPAAGSSPSEATASAVLGIVTWIGYTPIYIAQEKGFYQEQGLNLDVRVFNSGSEVIAAFGAGRIDGASMVPSEAVTVAANNKDFKIVYVVDTSNGGDGILARNSIGAIADFRGKQIAVEQGGVSHFFLLQVMQEAGLKESDVTLVNLTPADAAAAYQAGRVDIAVTYAPFLFTANEAQTDGRIIYDTSKLATPTSIADLILFDSAFAAANPNVVESFIRANAQALEFLNTNRQEGLAIAAKQLGLTAAELDEQLNGVKLLSLDENIEVLNNPNSDLFLLKPLNELVTFLKEQDKITSTPDMSKTLDPQFVLAAKG